MVGPSFPMLDTQPSASITAEGNMSLLVQVNSTNQEALYQVQPDQNVTTTIPQLTSLKADGGQQTYSLHKEPTSGLSPRDNGLGDYVQNDIARKDNVTNWVKVLKQESTLPIHGIVTVNRAVNGFNDLTSGMAAGTVPDAMESPIVPEDCSKSNGYTSTTTSYYGLPYQDHNYVAPPPSSPAHCPASPANSKINGHIEVDDDTSIAGLSTISTTPSNNSSNVIVDYDESVTRCICNFEHDDGYMICCDNCSVWQHIDCMDIDRGNIPDAYSCERCQPRPINAARAKALQQHKRELLAALATNSSTDTDEDEKMYKAVSSTPTTLKLTTTKKYKKSKKQRQKEMEKLEKKEKKKMMKKEKKDKRRKWDNTEQKFLYEKKKHVKKFTSPLFENENALGPWESDEEDSPWSKSYREITRSVYTSAVQTILATKRVNGLHPNSVDAKLAEQMREPLCTVVQFTDQRKGLETTENIRENQIIIEYVGHAMLTPQFQEENNFQDQMFPFVLFYKKYEPLDMCIDASKTGNDARFIRRSCTPNSEVRHLIENGSIRLYIVSSVTVPKGTEVTIPFDFNYQDCNYCIKCACFRANCPVNKFASKQEQRLLKKRHKAAMKQQQAHQQQLVDVTSIDVKQELSQDAKPAKKKKRQKSQSVSIDDDTNSLPQIAAGPAVTPTSPVPSPPKKKQRKLSPLRVNIKESTSAGNTPVKQPKVATKAELKEVVSPVKSEPKAVAAEAPVEVKEEPAHDVTSPQHGIEPHKMTREEKKMEAIMKAFEKLEKRQERRKEALTRLEHVKKEEQTEEKPVPPKASAGKVTPAKVAPAKGAPVKTPASKKKKAEEKEKEKEEKEVQPEPDVEKVEVTEEEAPIIEKPKPAARHRKAKKGHSTPARRRSRVNSGVSDTLSHDDTSNHAPVSSMSTPVTPVAAIPSGASLDVTTAPPSNPLCTQSASTLSPNMKGFRFPKTKKHLMNEWLNEKGAASDVVKPLTIKTESSEEENADFIKCVPSPQYSGLQHLRRSSFSSSAEMKPNLGIKALDSSMGSAKKRWLRQAMFENTPTSGGNSPVHNGSMSPLPAAPCDSPCGSPPADFVTPLKKRRLARASISTEMSLPPTPSTPSFPSQHVPKPHSEEIQDEEISKQINERLKPESSFGNDEIRRNGFRHNYLSPITPVTPSDNLFERFGQVNHQISIESDISESILSPHPHPLGELPRPRTSSAISSTTQDPRLDPELLPSKFRHKKSLNRCSDFDLESSDNQSTTDDEHVFNKNSSHGEERLNNRVTTGSLQSDDKNRNIDSCSEAIEIVSSGETKMINSDRTGHNEESLEDIVSNSDGNSRVGTQNSHLDPLPSTSGEHMNNSSSEILPSTSGSPSTSGTLPSTSGSLSSTSGSVPSTSGSVPSTSGSVPSTSGSVPSTSAGHVESSSNNTGNSPSVGTSDTAYKATNVDSTEQIETNATKVESSSVGTVGIADHLREAVTCSTDNASKGIDLDSSGAFEVHSADSGSVDSGHVEIQLDSSGVHSNTLNGPDSLSVAMSYQPMDRAHFSADSSSDNVCRSDLVPLDNVSTSVSPRRQFDSGLLSNSSESFVSSNLPMVNSVDMDMMSEQHRDKWVDSTSQQIALEEHVVETSGDNHSQRNTSMDISSSLQGQFGPRDSEAVGISVPEHSLSHHHMSEHALAQHHMLEHSLSNPSMPEHALPHPHSEEMFSQRPMGHNMHDLSVGEQRLQESGGLATSSSNGPIDQGTPPPKEKKRVSLLEYRQRLKQRSTSKDSRDQDSKQSNTPVKSTSSSSSTSSSPLLASPTLRAPGPSIRGSGIYTLAPLPLFVDTNSNSKPSSNHDKHRPIKGGLSAHAISSLSRSISNDSKDKREHRKRDQHPRSRDVRDRVREKERKVKPNMSHLSLSERLRKEFGLSDDEDDDLRKERRGGKLHVGCHSPRMCTPPPPPPPPPVAAARTPTRASPANHSRPNKGDGTSSSGTPPPPPPPHTSAHFSSGTGSHGASMRMKQPGGGTQPGPPNHGAPGGGIPSLLSLHIPPTFKVNNTGTSPGQPTSPVYPPSLPSPNLHRGNGASGSAPPLRTFTPPAYRQTPSSTDTGGHHSTQYSTSYNHRDSNKDSNSYTRRDSHSSRDSHLSRDSNQSRDSHSMREPNSYKQQTSHSVKDRNGKPKIEFAGYRK